MCPTALLRGAGSSWRQVLTMNAPAQVTRLPSSCPGLSMEAPESSVTNPAGTRRLSRKDGAGSGVTRHASSREHKAPRSSTERDGQDLCQGILPLLQPPSRSLLFWE